MIALLRSWILAGALLKGQARIQVVQEVPFCAQNSKHFSASIGHLTRSGLFDTLRRRLVRSPSRMPAQEEVHLSRNVRGGNFSGHLIRQRSRLPDQFSAVAGLKTRRRRRHRTP